jgi:hypothetical protein
LPGIFSATKDDRDFNFLADPTYQLYLTHGLVIAARFGRSPSAMVGERKLDAWLAGVKSERLATFLCSHRARSGGGDRLSCRGSARSLFVVVIDAVASCSSRASALVSKRALRAVR